MTTPPTPPNPPTFIDKLAYLYIQNRKLLMARSHGKDTWYTVGGKRHPGESDSEALIREVKEELGVNLIPDTLKYYGTFESQAHAKPEGTMVRITCYTGSFTGTPQASSEIAEISFLDSGPDHALTGTGRLIIDDLRAKKLID
jgi:8-oxo-dGTP diphosphatase